MRISRGNNRMYSEKNLLQRYAAHRECHMKLASASLRKLELLIPFSLVAGYRHFRGTDCLSLHGKCVWCQMLKRVAAVPRISPGTESTRRCVFGTP
jgi:hypothetical protein